MFSRLWSASGIGDSLNSIYYYCIWNSTYCQVQWIALRIWCSEAKRLTCSLRLYLTLHVRSVIYRGGIPVKKEDDAVETVSDILSKMNAEERRTVKREHLALSMPETSELSTGKRIVQVRTILEKYGIFWRFLKTLPFTERTAYRRIKSYERAAQMWPEEVVNAAIERRLRIIGWTAETPMGFFENVPAPSKNLTPQEIEEYLIEAE